MDSQPFYLVVGKSVQPETVEKLHKAVALLESRGELKRLLDKWYEE
jgi:ABC-type amino acid transport substrate-binding protein